MNTQDYLTESDWLIVSLLCILWTVLFGVFYYFVPNEYILLIGLLCAIVSTVGYVLVGGIHGLDPELQKPQINRDERGWRVMNSHEKRTEHRRAA